MIVALQHAHRGITTARDELTSAITIHACGSFRNAMTSGGAKESDADEYSTSLIHTMNQIKEKLDDLLRDLGSAEHVVAQGVARTPRRAMRSHLVLY